MKNTNSSSKKISIWDNFYIPVMIVCFIAIGFGYYVGDMLLGKESLDVLQRLQRDEKILKNNIKALEKSNKILQKKYFELRQLDPELRKEL